MSRRLRVLIVEDDYFIASYMADLIEEWGHDVAAMCATGAAAVEHLRRGGVELAVLDIKLKGDVSGLDVAEVARAEQVAHIFVSGSGDPVTHSAAQATGPIAFLQKPVNENQLHAILDGLLMEQLQT